MQYKHSIDDFAKALDGEVIPSGNGIQVPDPLDHTRNVVIYPNRDTKSKTAFFVQADADYRAQVTHHFSAILDGAGIDARDTGQRQPLLPPEPEAELPANAPELPATT